MQITDTRAVDRNFIGNWMDSQRFVLLYWRDPKAELRPLDYVKYRWFMGRYDACARARVGLWQPAKCRILAHISPVELGQFRK